MIKGFWWRFWTLLAVLIILIITTQVAVMRVLETQ
jgi:hypothetical protein